MARRALEALIVDGRIHPGRIEEVVAKSRKELDTEMQELGEQAAYETGIHGLHPEMIKLIGRMRYRTTYGQNILEHSKEVAWLAGMMAGELAPRRGPGQARGAAARRGQGADPRERGHPRRAGRRDGAKYGESAAVINCIQAHHDDVPHESAESVLVQAADAISGSRPGARREAFESYVKRLTKLEEIATGFPGRREDQRHPGRPRDPRRRDPGPDRRRRGGTAVGDHRPADRERAAVPGPDQGRRDPGDPRRGSRPVSATAAGRSRARQGHPRRGGRRGQGAPGPAASRRASRWCWSARIPPARSTSGARARPARRRGCTRSPSGCRPTTSQAELLAIIDRLNADPGHPRHPGPAAAAEAR